MKSIALGLGAVVIDKVGIMPQNNALTLALERTSIDRSPEGKFAGSFSVSPSGSISDKASDQDERLLFSQSA